MVLHSYQRNEDEVLLGVPMTEEAFEDVISRESPYRYELIDGVIYDMTGSSPEHSIIAGNIDRLFQEQLGRRGPCITHRDQYVAIPGRPPVVPDVVVTCDLGDRDKDKRSKPFRIQSPLIVVEVLSPGTEKYDRGEKFERYKLCTSFEVYMLVRQDGREVEVYRRKNEWEREVMVGQEVVMLDQLDLELGLDDVYDGVL